jgi:L-aspartate oxidase
MAARAGARLVDLEFVQFHPTALAAGGDPLPLLTEELRGEGAVLVDGRGRRFMPDEHLQAELAPRDVVARAIDREMKTRGEPHVYLDITHRRAAEVRRRFPGIDARLRGYGFDLTKEPVPVVPAAHYMCGGVRATLSGRTPLHGLLALGEVACTGLHGANRLASNSLLEALVAAHHAVREVRLRLGRAPRPPRPAPWSTQGTSPPHEKVVFDHHWDTVRRVMWDLVGIVRSDRRLAFAERRLAMFSEEIERDYLRLRLQPDFIELRNIALVGTLIVRAAKARHESRGLHYNVDHPRPLATRPRSRSFRRRRPFRRRLARPAALDL